MACRVRLSRMLSIVAAAAAVFVAVLLIVPRASAQAPQPQQPPGTKPEMAENCPGLIRSNPPRVRNVPTNIRTWSGGTERHGNSIFVFEMANMCMAHLGHLHHTLNQQQLNEVGRIDVLFVPVDGNLTLDMDGMIEVLQAMKAP